MTNSIARVFYHESAFAEVTAILNAVSDVSSAHRQLRARCACHRAQFVVERYLRCTSLEASDRYIVKEEHRRFLAHAADVLGWESLRGWAGRRKALEKLASPPAYPGRPRKMFFTASDLEWAEDFLDHAREVTPADIQEHIDERMFEVVWTIDVSIERGPQNIRGAAVSEFIDRARDVIEEARRLSPGMYRRRKKRLAARLLAEMFECSPKSVRDLVPERAEPGLQRAADAVGSYLRALPRLADIKLNRPPNEARDVAVDPGAVRRLAEDEDEARELQERANRAGRARRWS